MTVMQETSINRIQNLLAQCEECWNEFETTISKVSQEYSDSVYNLYQSIK